MEASATPTLSYWDNLYLHSQVSLRKGKLALKEALKVNQLVSVSSAAVTVFGIGVLEARMLVSKSVTRSDAIKFYVRYGAHQVLPSIIWNTKPAAVVVRSMGKNPQSFLRNFDLNNNLVDAKMSLRITTAQTLRSVLAGFVGIAQILRLCHSAADANLRFVDAVNSGKEPLLKGIPNRIIRIAGESSDVTSLTIRNDGFHLVPIVKEPKNSFCEELRSIIGKNNNFPMYVEYNCSFYQYQ